MGAESNGVASTKKVDKATTGRGSTQSRRDRRLVVRKGELYFVEPPLETMPVLPADNYVVHHNEMTDTYYLVKADPFVVPDKVYGNPQATVDRCLFTARNRPRSTGVLLSGFKGSGKTMTAQMICRQSGWPVLMVNQPYIGDSFKAFINDVPGDVVVFFDEFEKVYSRERQEHLLTLLDGNYQSRRLFLMTSNTADISTFLRNRPGRVFYKKEYSSVDMAVVKQYAEDNLLDRSQVDELCTLVRILDNCSMDALSSIVEEMNRYGETPKVAASHMNIEIEGSLYDYKWTVGGLEGVRNSYGQKHPLIEGHTGRFDLYLNKSLKPLKGASVYHNGMPTGEGKNSREPQVNVMFGMTVPPDGFKHNPADGSFSASFTLTKSDVGGPTLLRFGSLKPVDDFKLVVSVTATKVGRSGGGFLGLSDDEY